jgi:hypothetical protein
MKTSLSQLSIAAAALAITTLASAAAEPPFFRWHLEAGPSLWLKSRVTFGATTTADPALSPKTDRLYDDGFNRVDASGNLGDGPAGPLTSRTGYFAYTSDAQVDLNAGTLALHRTQLAAGPFLSDDAKHRQPAWHLNAQVSLQRTPRPDRDWGLGAGAEFSTLRQTSSGPVAANLRILTDTYALGGVVPQRAPYSGRFSPLPGDQRIGDTPNRTVTTTNGTLNGRRELVSRTTILHLGPWFQFGRARDERDLPESDHWSLQVRGGVAYFVSRVTFATSDQLTATGAVVNATGGRNRSDFGAFAGLSLRRAFTPRLALVIGADALWGPRLTVTQGNRYALLDLHAPLILMVGLEFGFAKR